jgi:hypothetical protein
MPVLIDEEIQQAYAWEDKDATIGRTPENTVQIPLPGVSRHHCRIVLRGVHYTIQDLGSKNGTILNGKLMADKELLLQPGDAVNLGKRRLRFELKAPADLKPPKPSDEKPPVTEDLFKPTIEYVKEPPISEVSQPPAPSQTAKPASLPDAVKPAEESEDEPLRFIDDSAVIERRPTTPAVSPPSPAGPPKEAPTDHGRRAGEVICPKCISANLPGSETCWNCKAPLPKGAAEVVIPESQRAFGGQCPHCRAPYAAGVMICPNCGMNLADRRAVVSSHTRVLREELFWATAGILVLLVLIGAFGYYFFFWQQESAGVNKIELYTTKLDRAEDTFKEAKGEESLRRYDRALDLYKEAEDLAKEACEGLSDAEEPGVRKRGQELLERFSAQWKSYAEWFQANRARLEAEEEFRKESEEQTRQGRVFFHGGWIRPEDEGLVPAEGRLVFPEEEALEKALAKEKTDKAELDARLGALLRRIGAFQEKFHLEQRFWKRQQGPLPQPEPAMSGALGTCYPEDISAARFPGVYLVQVAFSASDSPPRGSIRWDEANGRAQIAVVFHDSTAQAKAATEAKDIVALSQRASLVSSRVTTTFASRDSKEDCAFLNNLVQEGTPPILQLFFKVSDLRSECASKQIPHDLSDGTKFSQKLTHYEYAFTLAVLQARWVRRLPGEAPIYLPLFPEREPKDGLYQAAIHALGMGEGGKEE